MIERHALIALVLGGCAITGCQDAPQASIQEHGGSGDEPARVLLVETSTQRVLGVDSVAALASEISYSSSGPGTCPSPAASVRLDSYGDALWVMSRVRVGNLDILDAPAGTYSAGGFIFDGYTSSTEYSVRGTLYVSVRTASGTSYGEESFSDASPTDASITISDNDDGSRTLAFRARYEDSGEIAAGTLVYREAAAAPPPPVEVAPTPAATTASQVGSDLRQRHVLGATYDTR